MRLATWIVTEVHQDDLQASVHFVVASTADRARDLVTRSTLIPGDSLNAVRLSEELSPVPPKRRREPRLERYLGPLEKFSPFLRDACGFCRGTGLVVGSRPAQKCPTCQGSGFKTVRRR